jgi:hypothetical protein
MDLLPNKICKKFTAWAILAKGFLPHPFPRFTKVSKFIIQRGGGGVDGGKSSYKKRRRLSVVFAHFFTYAKARKGCNFTYIVSVPLIYKIVHEKKKNRTA